MPRRPRIDLPGYHHIVNRGYVDDTMHWRYSSARDYESIEGLLEVERFW